MGGVVPPGTSIVRGFLGEGQATPHSILVGSARLAHFPPAISLPQTSDKEETSSHIVLVAEGCVQ